MAEQRHGRYYAQELMMDQEANIREQTRMPSTPASITSGTSWGHPTWCRGKG
jgi:hypothetical protein